MLTDTDRHQFIGKIDFPTLTWDEVIFNFNKNVVENTDYKLMDNFGFVTHQTEHNRKIYKIGDELQKIFPNNSITAHLYVSFLEISKTFGRHNDNSHVFFWQCIGITQWKVWDDKEYTYNLMPGEVLYVPAGMDHDTKPITPRAGISFGIELK
jgi:ribosomal protein L16 Arg81 hydroxylase